jgi:hypothetical protein
MHVGDEDLGDIEIAEMRFHQLQGPKELFQEITDKGGGKIN